jgi:D-alanyl-D-alanine carboxypeptidase
MEQFERMMELVIKPTGNTPIYNCMLSVKSARTGLNFSSAIGSTGEAGETISPFYGFRTGSISKLFTATIILQLAEDGLLKLEDLYFELISEDTKKKLSRLHCFEEVDYSSNISLLHLLTHTSGLRDYFSEDERFLAYVMEHPLQSWNWTLVMEKYFEFGINKKPAFIPGESFHYSDTNYLLLAVLIEQITDQLIQELYRKKIITPLGLTDTYLEFYEVSEQSKPVVYPYYKIQSLEKINTSFDWGGGGLISTMNDLDIFIRSLIKGILFKKIESLELLMRYGNTIPGRQKTNDLNNYGIGIQKKGVPGYTFLGHNGAYGSMLFYAPAHDISIVLSLNQAFAIHKAEWLFKEIIRILK